MNSASEAPTAAVPARTLRTIMGELRQLTDGLGPVFARPIGLFVEALVRAIEYHDRRLSEMVDTDGIAHAQRKLAALQGELTRLEERIRIKTAEMRRLDESFGFLTQSVSNIRKLVDGQLNDIRLHINAAFSEALAAEREFFFGSRRGHHGYVHP